MNAFTKTIDLRGLDKDAHAAKLNRAIAEDLAKLGNVHYIDHVQVYGGEYPGVRSVPDYANSVDAVVPLLDRHRWSRGEDGTVTVTTGKHGEFRTFDSRSRYSGLSFATNACLALLRANGCEVIL